MPINIGVADFQKVLFFAFLAENLKIPFFQNNWWLISMMSSGFFFQKIFAFLTVLFSATEKKRPLKPLIKVILKQITQCILQNKLDQL